MSEKTFTPGGKSPYAQRKARRLNGAPMKARERMPRFYTEMLADFAQREREQQKVLFAGLSLSRDPMRPWGAGRGPSVEQFEE